MNINLDRRSKVDIATQIELAFRKAIYSYEYSFNDVLPSIDDLVSLLLVDEVTIKSAYQKLIKDHLVQLKDGRYWVEKVDVPVHWFNEITPLVKLIEAVQLIPSIDTLSFEVIATPKQLKNDIQEEKVIRCKRVYSGSGRPIFYLDIYLNLNYLFLKEALINNQPYYDLIQKRSPFAFSKRSYEAYNASKEVASILNIPDFSPVVYSRISSFDTSQNWIEVIESYSLVELQHFVYES